MACRIHHRFPRGAALALLSTLTVAACSGEGATPTDVRPAFDNVPCINNVAVQIPGDGTITKPRNTTTTVRLKVQNLCSNSSSTWDLTTSRSGAVASVSAPSPSSITLAPSAAASVFVTYTTGGTAGTGTVKLTATQDLGIITRTGTLTVTVTP
jgi:hypothetical protein